MSTSDERLSGIARAAIAACAILTLVFAILIGDATQPRRELYDEGVYRNLTSNLLDHGFYGYERDQLVAFRAPGYPLFNAGIRLLSDSYLAIRVAQALLAAGIITLIALIALRLYGSRAAVAAGALAAATGSVAAYAAVEMTETLATFSLLTAVLLALHAASSRSRNVAAASGIALGVSILTRPQAFPFLLILAIVLFKSSTRRRGAVTLLFALGALAVIAPWTIRNFARLGHFVPISTEGGVNFFLANNANSTGRFVEIDIVAPREYARISQLPEVQQDREWMRLGATYVREHPLRSFWSWGRNGVVYAGSRDGWVHGRARLRDRMPLPALDDRLLWPFAAAGAFIVARKRRTAATMLPIAAVITLVAIFSVTIPHARFRHQLLPFLVILAAAGTMRGFGRQRGRRQTNGS